MENRFRTPIPQGRCERVVQVPLRSWLSADG